MKRRTVVSVVGASVVPLTGCFGQASPGADPTDNATDTVADTELPPSTPRNGPRTVSLSGVDDVSNGPPLSPSVEVSQPDVTADQTAQIRTTLTNTADTPAWNMDVRIRTFGNFITQAGPQNQQLLLLNPDGDYETVRPACWRADINRPTLDHAYTNTVSDIQYAPGETRSNTFDIYGHPENIGPCLAPGNYPIEAEYAISDDSNTDTPEWEYQWGFSITVEES